MSQSCAKEGDDTSQEQHNVHRVEPHSEALRRPQQAPGLELALALVLRHIICDPRGVRVFWLRCAAALAATCTALWRQCGNTPVVRVRHMRDTDVWSGLLRWRGLRWLHRLDVPDWVDLVSDDFSALGRLR